MPTRRITNSSSTILKHPSCFDLFCKQLNLPQICLHPVYLHFQHQPWDQWTWKRIPSFYLKFWIKNAVLEKERLNSLFCSELDRYRLQTVWEKLIFDKIENLSIKPKVFKIHSRGNRTLMAGLKSFKNLWLNLSTEINHLKGRIAWQNICKRYNSNCIKFHPNFCEKEIEERFKKTKPQYTFHDKSIIDQKDVDCTLITGCQIPWPVFERITQAVVEHAWIIHASWTQIWDFFISQKRKQWRNKFHSLEFDFQ